VAAGIDDGDPQPIRGQRQIVEEIPAHDLGGPRAAVDVVAREDRSARGQDHFVDDPRLLDHPAGLLLPELEVDHVP